MPAALEIIEAGEVSEIRLTIQEGKFHQVKRMFESQGMKVTYLKRESMGTLRLDETLKIGEYRPLTEAELESL
jgi:16S rRNA pseudouridine516 synthase